MPFRASFFICENSENIAILCLFAPESQKNEQNRTHFLLFLAKKEISLFAINDYFCSP